MGLLAVGSLHGSPGATTLAVAVAAHLDGLLVEADPDGGVLAARLDLKLAPTLTDLAGTARGGISADGLAPFGQRLTATAQVVVAHPSAEQTSAALRVGAAPLAAALSGGPEPRAVVDVGRLRPGTPALPLLVAADRVVVVVRPVLEQVLGVLHGTAWLGESVLLGLVLVGERPYSARQVADVTGLPVLGVVPDDPAAVIAGPLAGGAKRRDPVASAVGALAARLDVRPGGRPGRRPGPRSVTLA